MSERVGSQDEMLEAAEDSVWNNPQRTEEGRLSKLDALDVVERYHDGGEVLEIGSGPGFTTEEISRTLAGAEVEGRDISEDLDYPLTSDETMWTVRRGTALEPNFDGKADLIVSAHCLGQIVDKSVIPEWFQDYTEREYAEEVLERMKNVSGPQSNFILIDDGNYLVAERKDGEWVPVEARDHKFTRQIRGGQFGREYEDSSDHRNMYETWLDVMTDSDYVVKVKDDRK